MPDISLKLVNRAAGIPYFNGYFAVSYVSKYFVETPMPSGGGVEARIYLRRSQSKIDGSKRKRANGEPAAAAPWFTAGADNVHGARQENRGCGFKRAPSLKYCF